jgi:chromosome partitioning protein
VNLIKSASQMIRREIPRRVVLMAAQPGTKIAEHIEKEVAKAGLPVLSTRLDRLVAFQEMSFTGVAPTTGHAGFQCSRFLDELEALGGLPEAKKLAS